MDFSSIFETFQKRRLLIMHLKWECDNFNGHKAGFGVEEDLKTFSLVQGASYKGFIRSHLGKAC